MNSLSFCLTHLAHSFGRGVKCLFYQLQGTIVQLFRNIGNQQYAEYRMLCETIITCPLVGLSFILF